MGTESEYIHKRHNVSVIIYHYVCPAKYRRVVVSEAVDRTIKFTCEELEKRFEMRFLEIGADGDHVHFLGSVDTRDNEGFLDDFYVRRKHFFCRIVELCKEKILMRDAKSGKKHQWRLVSTPLNSPSKSDIIANEEYACIPRLLIRRHFLVLTRQNFNEKPKKADFLPYISFAFVNNSIKTKFSLGMIQDCERIFG